MTLQWYEGAEVHAIGADYDRMYQSGGAGMARAASPRVPPGSFALSNSAAGNPLVTPSLGVQNTWFVGIGMTESAADDVVFSFRKAGVEQCYLKRIDQTGNLFKLAIMRGAVEVDITTDTYDSTIWHYFELKVVVRTGTNGSYELRHNEVTVASLTGSSVNLAEGGSDGADIFGFAPVGKSDDIYILDDQGSVNNTFLGDSAVYEILPDGDGDVTDWTTSTGSSHFDLVNNLGVEYVSSDTNTQKDLFDFAALPTTGLGAIFGLMTVPTCRMEAVGSRTLKPVFRNAADAEGDGANFVVTGVASLDYPVIMELNPVSSSAWTKTDIDDGQLGVEVVS